MPETIIIRTPYPDLDERLFPPGWRSFPQLFYSSNLLECSGKIISLNNISGELKSLYTSINDIDNGIYVTFPAIINLECSSTIEAVNHINAESISEIISINDIDNKIYSNFSCLINFECSAVFSATNKINGETKNTFSSINILAKDCYKKIISENMIGYFIVDKDFIGINRISSPLAIESYTHIFNIIIDGLNVTDEVVSWNIEMNEDSYVNSFSAVFAGKEFLSNCNPTINIGEKRIKITIDNEIFWFLLEKRSISRDPENSSFSIWGRSFIATLDMPYIAPIFDKQVVQDPNTGTWYCPDDNQYVPHIWQTSEVMVSDIIEYLIGNNFNLVFNIDDFVVRKDSFSAEGDTPIQIISKLLDLIGAHIRTDKNDNVIIRYWSFDSLDNSVAEFTDMENILMLDEDVTFPDGGNKILVKGYADPTEEESSSLKIELDDVLNNGETRFLFSEEIYVRIYKSPFTVTYDISVSLGSIYLVTENIAETITRESTGFYGDSLRTEKPINTITSIEKYDCSIIPSGDYSFTQGFDLVIPDSNSGIKEEPVLISYTSRYDLYKMVVPQPCSPLPAEEIISRIRVEEN